MSPHTKTANWTFSVLQGFTIQNAYRVNSDWKRLGGRIRCINGASPLITNCILRNNTADYGGGIFTESSSTVKILNCSFQGNTATVSGGGIYCHWGSPIISTCILENNTSLENNGGGVFSYLSSINMTNCLLTGNTANYGGAISCYRTFDMNITNCTVTENIATSSGGSLFCNDITSVEVKNCILWNNSPNEILDFSSGIDPDVTFSCIQGGYDGAGNIEQNPLFTTGSEGRHYLSQLDSGQTINSPCVDSGNILASDLCFTSSEGTECFNSHWTRVDEICDSGFVDMAVHYPLPTKPAVTGVQIWMPSSNFRPDDNCSCKATVINYEESQLSGYPLFVILSVGDQLFFAPDFNDFGYYAQDFPEGETSLNILTEFSWPTGVGSASGLLWYGALTNPEMTELVGELGVFEFGWSE